jgi:hypothetical protein
MACAKGWGCVVAQRRRTLPLPSRSSPVTVPFAATCSSPFWGSVAGLGIVDARRDVRAILWQSIGNES